MKYLADEDGNIYNSYGKKIKLNDNGKGYLIFNQYYDGKRRTTKAHRFIWEFFNGKIPDHLQIDHINHDKKDNRLDNLRIVTNKTNSRRRRSNKLNMRKAHIIRKLYELGLGDTYKLAERYGVDQSLISRIINYKVWA